MPRGPHNKQPGVVAFGRRKDGKPLFVMEHEPPVCPRAMSSDAKAEWRRIVPPLAKVKLLHKVDTGALQDYCELAVLYDRAAKAGRVDDMTGLAPILARLRRDLGLTPEARSKLGATLPTA